MREARSCAVTYGVGRSARHRGRATRLIDSADLHRLKTLILRGACQIRIEFDLVQVVARDPAEQPLSPV